MSDQTTGRHLSKAEPERKSAPAPERVETVRVQREPERKRPALDLFVRWFLLALLLAATVALVVMIVRTKMISTKFLIAICVLLGALFALTALLMLAFGKKHRPWGGIVLSVVLTAVMAAGCYYGFQGTQTLQNITSNSTTYTASHVGVYVRQDDPAQSMDQVADYTIGVMESMGREAVDKAVAELGSQLGTSLQTTGFATPTQLVNALFDGSVNAVIADTAYLEGLREMEDYTGLIDQMREVTKMRVQLAKPTEAPEEEKEEDEEQETPMTEHVYTVLITGIDSRYGLVPSSLSDVNILVTVNTDTRQALLVSTPRDYKVNFPSVGYEDKLTHAGWFGEQECMDAIGELYDVDVDYYFRINFEGFVNIIDALGGVTVNSPMTFDSKNVPGYHYEEGPNEMDGASALAFVRERFVFEDGDAQRGRNQLEMIRGIIHKVMSPELLARYSSLMTAVEGSFEMTIPYDLIASLIRRQLDEGGDWNIVSYSVGGEGTHEISPTLGTEVYMTIPDETTVQTAKDMMAQVFSGQKLTAEGETVGT